MGNVTKLMIVKLNGGKDSVVNAPMIKGAIYNTNKRLFKYFSSID